MKFSKVIGAALVVAACSSLYAQDRGSGPEAAKADLSKMTVADGLEVTLFASEPMLLNPTDMDVDSKGRVWICEGVNYRVFQKWGTLRPEGDRIVILEDSDGDGAADKEKVFYQGLEVNSALGIAVLGKKVIVSRSPNIMVFTDNDGDDKADGKPEIIFSGIGGVDHDHGAHAFVFGPDGKLYFNVGNDGKQLKTPDGSKFIVDKAGNEIAGHGKPYRQGLVFRCDQDFKNVETLGWNFRNNYEVAVDSFGTLWQSDNDDDGNTGVRINYVMEFGNYGYTDEMTGAGWNKTRTNMEYQEKDGQIVKDSNGKPVLDKPRAHWHQNDPGVIPNFVNTGGGSPTGITVYEGKLLPEIFHNQVIHCDAGPRVVRAYPAETDGAGYKGSIVNILTSSDSWYRPSDVCVAPDGSLYIADWNDAGVGGHNMADRDPAKMRGRVYRVAPKGHKPTAPKLDLQTPAGAIAALQSPNMATRYLAWTALHEMGSKAEGELTKLWNSNDQRQRARALHLLARIKGKEANYIGAAIKDSNPDIRITGLRIARSLDRDVIPIVKALVKDPSPAVRRECAIALRHNKSSEAPALWAALAEQHDGRDRWYLEALGLAADKQENPFFEAWLSKVGDKWNSPAGRDIVWRSRSNKVPAMLVKIIQGKNTTEREKQRYIRALDFIKGPEKEAALVELIGVN